jgi:hypothetical protein
MTTKYFSAVDRWRIPQSVIRESLTEMARDGEVGNEGVMLWLGRRDGSLVEVTHPVALRGPGVIKKPNYLMIEPELLNEVTDLGIQLGAYLVGQIHSHGSEDFIDLSRTDRLYGFHAPFYLSLVAPEYALNPRTGITDCGVHVYELGAGYRRLSRQEVLRKIEVVEGPDLAVFIVGGE